MKPFMLYSIILPIAVAVVGFIVWLMLRWWRNKKDMEPPQYVPDPFFIYVKEGKTGLETFVSGQLNFLPKPYRVQLSAFLYAVINDMSGDSGSVEGLTVSTVPSNEATAADSPSKQGRGAKRGV